MILNQRQDWSSQALGCIYHLFCDRFAQRDPSNSKTVLSFYIRTSLGYISTALFIFFTELQISQAPTAELRQQTDQNNSTATCKRKGQSDPTERLSRNSFSYLTSLGIPRHINTGIINRVESFAFYKLKDMSYSDQQLRQAVDAVFGKYDADNSGSLDPSEVTNLINDALGHMNSNKKVSQQEVQQFVNAVDKSGDGKIQKPELYEIFKKVL